MACDHQRNATVIFRVFPGDSILFKVFYFKPGTVSIKVSTAMITIATI